MRRAGHQHRVAFGDAAADGDRNRRWMLDRPSAAEDRVLGPDIARYCVG
jgi:hypothetical protein